MPFTLSHTIAIAPFWFIFKRRLDLMALCIGSMVPDLDLYMPFVPEGGHTLRGWIAIDLPWAILLLLIVRWLLTKPFIALMPPYLASCLPLPAMSNVLSAVASVLIGALSHIVWDAFTHEGGWFVTHYSFLESQIGTWPVYKLLQHGCGVLGLIAVAFWIAWALGQAQPQHRPESLPLRYRWFIITGILVVAAISAVVEIKTSYRPSRESTLVRGVVGSLTGLGTGFLAYASGFWLLRGINKKFS